VHHIALPFTKVTLPTLLLVPGNSFKFAVVVTTPTIPAPGGLLPPSVSRQYFFSTARFLRKSAVISSPSLRNEKATKIKKTAVIPKTMNAWSFCMLITHTTTFAEKYA
jgi:hypothetical protein